MTDFEEYYNEAESKIYDIEERLKKADGMNYDQRLDMMDRLKALYKDANIDINLA